MIFGVELDESFVQAKRLGLVFHLLVEFGYAKNHCRIEAVVALPLLKNWNCLTAASFGPHQTYKTLEAVLKVRIHSDCFFEPKARLVVVFECLPPFRDFEA